MLNFNVKEISILNMLLKQEYVEVETIMQTFDISLRTAQSEINMINEMLKNEGKHSVQIYNQRGKGYFLGYPFEELTWIEKLKKECYDYLNLSIFRRLGKRERVPHIIRLLLSSAGGIKAEDLADLLNISIATLNKDMRTVRKCLLMYGIEIISIPYYGMKAAGKEMAIHSCIIDFCDIHNFSSESIFTRHSLKEYGITMADINQNSANLRKVLLENSYTLSDTGFNRVTLYLTTLHLRINVQNKQCQDFPEHLKELQEYKIAKKMLGENQKDEAYSYLAIFLLGNRDLYEIDAAVSLEKIVPEGKALCQKVLESLKRRISLDISPYHDIKEYILLYFYKWTLRKRFFMTEMEVPMSIIKAAEKMISSSALAVYIYEEASVYLENGSKDIMFYELILTIYNSLYHIRNQYEPTNIILVNEVGKLSQDITINRMGLNNGMLNVHFYVYYLYQLADLDYSKYDYVFLPDGMKFSPENIPIPVYQYRFFEKFASDLWAKLIARKRKIGAVLKYMENPEIVTLDCSQEDAADKITAYFLSEGRLNLNSDTKYFENLMKSCIYFTNYVTGNRDKYINIFSESKIKQHYFIFKLTNPVIINDRKVERIHIVVLDLSKGVVEIKNGDSELRHYIEHN